MLTYIKKQRKLKQVTKRYKPISNRQLNSIAALAVCTMVAGIGVYMLMRGQAESFCDISPANNVLAIESAINGCADGTTIRFPADASYVLSDTIFVRDRHNLVIDGRNSQFTITTDGETKPSINRIAPGYNQNSFNGGNWMLLRGTNITLKNIRAIGSFPPGLNGEARDITKENRPEYINDEDGDGRYRYTESMSNFGVYGTDGALLQDLYGKAPWGDTVTTGTDHYVDNFYNEHGGETRLEGSNTVNLGNYTRNLTVTRVRSEEPSRMCFALTSGRIMTVQDSYCKSAWYGGTDQEIDEYRQPLESVSFLRNTFEGFNLFGYLLPVAGVYTSDIHIKYNSFITPPDTQCNPTIGLGGYPDNPETIKGAYIENNTMVAYATAIQLDSVAGGTIKNNKITTIEGGGCGNGVGSPAPLVNVSARSTNVAQENNGPNAPGAAGAVSPPADTESPTVGINSPANGANVSQTIAVTASASDNVGVTKVEFLIDNQLRETDTSGPYSFNWNTANEANGSHNVTAKAYDAAGNGPVTSASVSVTVNNSTTTPGDTTPPSAPANLTAAVASNPSRVNLTWTAATDNVGVTKYYVVRNGTTIASLGRVTSYSDSSVDAGVSYSYTVIAEDGAGNAGPQSTAASAAIPPANPPAGNQPPSAPSNLQAEVISGSQINLSWTAASDDNRVIYYHIWRNNTKIADVHYNTGTSFGDSSVQPGNTYNYYVTASDANGALGPSSATRSVTTPVTNNPPSVTGDVNRDGKVNFDDALAVIRKWNQNDAEADLNKDNKVNFDDAILIIRNWRN